ncbi:hypothetical protein EVAR_67672_1 [Eumeta japonica]|uniref:Uncharacterized protein n=1 Tax=Eumeta variegata TaxID=151549 RepID=A0A4C1ZA79_EUMVA|nr:hypothetical protein EVAR_67672_1 [Eumeta japonica]
MRSTPDKSCSSTAWQNSAIQYTPRILGLPKLVGPSKHSPARHVTGPEITGSVKIEPSYGSPWLSSVFTLT